MVAKGAWGVPCFSRSVVGFDSRRRWETNRSFPSRNRSRASEAEIMVEFSFHRSDQSVLRRTGRIVGTPRVQRQKSFAKTDH